MFLPGKSLGSICLLVSRLQANTITLSLDTGMFWGTSPLPTLQSPVRFDEVTSRAALCGHSSFCHSGFLTISACLDLQSAKEEQDSLNRTIWNAVPLRLKCLFLSSKKSKSRYSELSFEKSIHPLKFTDLSSQVVPPLAVSQVTALYNPSLNNIHHDK